MFTHVTRGQISHGGSPYAYSLKSALKVAFINMPFVDNEAMIARDTYTWRKKGPYNFGENTDVNLGLDNSGSWNNLENGDRIWNLGIRSEGAFSINLIFSEYELPEGATVFIYNEDKTYFIGSFDHTNNKPHGKLGTSLIRGEAIIIEYYEPEPVKGLGKLRVGNVTHAYKEVYKKSGSIIPGYGAADDCTININCPQGDDWQTQSRSVVQILVNGNTLCSGTLLNNTNNDGTPFILTANHCMGKNDGSTFVYLFNYESPICGNSYPRVDNTVSGSVLRSKNKGSDFVLLEMSSPPTANYNAVFSGWSRSRTSPTRFICIGHPSGDIKKWNEEFPKGRESGYWWTAPVLNSGQTEYGSSGSGVWDQNGRLVGQLYGGNGWCNDVDSTNYWGRFDRSWNGASGSTSRLKDWLDPTGTDTMFIDHFDPNATSTPEITYQVNMSYIEDYYEGDAVRVSFGDRESWVEMTDADGDSIYTCTVSQDVGTGLKYYFSYLKSTTPDTIYMDERDSLTGSECCDDEGYRTLTVEARNQTLPAVIFGSCLAYPRLPNVTFRVDLNKITNLYAGGSVWVGFGNWISWKEMTDPDGDGIYIGTVPLEKGSEWSYMFGYQNGSNPNVNYVDERNRLKGTECADELGFRSLADELGFRSLAVPHSDLSLPTIVYGTCLESTTSVFEPGFVDKVNIYYNSVNDLVKISNSFEVENVKIYSVTGQLLVNVRSNNQ